MKQFIVLAAILPILLVFTAQFTLEAGRHLRMNAAEDAIRAFCLEASYYNGGGEAQANALRERLARVFHVDARDITIELSMPDASHIDWKISFPVGEIMAGARLMGISPSENQGRARMSGTIVVAREPEPPHVEPETPDKPETPDDTPDKPETPDDKPD